MEKVDLRYPIGKFRSPEAFNTEMLQQFIADIEQFPGKVVEEVGPLTPDQQQWIYRPEGWSIKQVVHHCADSHMNAFMRFKLSLTEERPRIKPYLEAEWAKQVDYDLPVIHSIKMLEGLHHRWTNLLKSLEPVQYERSFYHPESQKDWSLYKTAALYSWHCKHHLGHIKQAKQYKGKFE